MEMGKPRFTTFVAPSLPVSSPTDPDCNLHRTLGLHGPGSQHPQMPNDTTGNSTRKIICIILLSTKINIKASQLVSINWKVGSVTEITVSCYLHLCLSVFISFPIMFLTQSVRSKLIYSAPIDSAFWYYCLLFCLLFFPHLLLFRMIITFSALIYSIYFSPTYPSADADAKLRL